MAKKRKDYTNANKILEEVLNNKIIDSNREIEIKNEIIEFAQMKYKNEFDDNKVTFSMWLKSYKNIEWRKGEYFVKIFYDEINYVKATQGLSIRESNLLYSLSQFLMYETNLLVNESGEPMTREMLAEGTGMHPNSISRSMKCLIDKKLIITLKEGRKTHYIVNPYIMFSGKTIHKDLVDIFKQVGYIPRECN